MTNPPWIQCSVLYLNKVSAKRLQFIQTQSEGNRDNRYTLSKTVLYMLQWLYNHNRRIIKMQKLGRNDPCHCGSNLKYKKCCLDKDEANKIARITTPANPEAALYHFIETELSWPNVFHQLIAEHFTNQTIGFYPHDQLAAILKMWEHYANAVVPVSKKPGVFPAALEYILCQNFGHQTTQQELAAKYNISATTLSQRANQIFDYMDEHLPSISEDNGSPVAPPNSRFALEQEMGAISSLLENQNFASIEEVNSFMQKHLNEKPTPSKPKKGISKAEQASELIYDAWDEPNVKRRIKLAQDALLLYPGSVDAYNILAESAAASPKERAYYYKQGMLIGEQELGEAFFKEHKGHFWGYFPTRPYMRAKKGYAETCADMLNIPEAIRHYRELLELNPGDNQGVRELLLSAYIESSAWEDAEDLIKKYDDDSAYFNYSRILAAFGLYGNSPTELAPFFKRAIAQNPHVPAFLLGKKRLPREMPEYIGWGDVNEAIAYVLLNNYLWQSNPGLLQLLASRKKR
ncbi:hypothetical protein EBB07_19315 [Paenibacillaceae bacterium]|nr:hypothetical protein EBB07_19315 [Paenibacillaceae bacterium]